MSKERDETSAGGEREGGGDDNLLLLDESADVIPAESEDAIRTLGAQIAEYEQRGEDGLRPLRVLLDRVGEVVFSTGESSIARLQEEEQRDSIPGDVILFAARIIEVLVRALEDVALLSSGVRFILREAPEAIVVAHALAAIDVMRQSSAAHLRERGYSAYQECLTIARARGFGERVQRAFDASEEKSDEGANDAGDGTNRAG